MNIQVTIDGIHNERIEKAVMNYALAMIRIFVNTMDRKREKSKPRLVSEVARPKRSDEPRF